MSFSPSSPVLLALSLSCLNSYFKFCCISFTCEKVRSFLSQLPLNSSKISFQIAVPNCRKLLSVFQNEEPSCSALLSPQQTSQLLLVSVSVSVHVFPILVLWTILTRTWVVWNIRCSKLYLLKLLSCEEMTRWIHWMFQWPIRICCWIKRKSMVQAVFENRSQIGLLAQPFISTFLSFL